ncbi:mob kinase activator-like 1 [Anaeramoeba ignava]|uniref:Mob kinase activator-like 1 n=1 Tax=Anaeramoeba ignava TaxID=1746090 RepID=A0A9Q0RH25_ANAIG|nr:mob kinase activator-like 1 [Anaeramoeba ignava]
MRILTKGNLVDFFNQVTMLYGSISEYCTEETCKVMSAGPQYEYYWADGVTVKKPIQVSAPEYVNRLMTWIQSQLDNEEIFPSRMGYSFPKNFMSIVKTIFKRLFRVYGHIYHHHFKEISSLGEEAHLNTSFKHFIFFMNEFRILDKKEKAPLRELIQHFIDKDKKREKENLGWWDNSHMIIIEIASRNLTTSQKNTLLDILSTWEPDFPGDLYAAAIWPDQIKQPPIKIDSMAGWHFADLVYNPDNIKVNYTLPPENVIVECQQALDTLKDKSCTSVWAWAFQLRQLFHFVGDIHQPLHCIDRFTKQFPDGDRGGNEFKLKGNASYEKNLHYFWDSAAGEYVTNYPLTQNQIAQLVANATEIMKNIQFLISKEDSVQQILILIDGQMKHIQQLLNMHIQILNQILHHQVVTLQDVSKFHKNKLLLLDIDLGLVF